VSLKLLAYILNIAGLLLFSSNAKSSGSNAISPRETVISREIQSNFINAADFAGKLDELLTLEMAVKVCGFDALKVIKEHEIKAGAAFGGKKRAVRECSYLWENGRTRTITVGGNTMNAPYKDKVGINSVSNTTLERFKRNYGALTNKQKIAANKQIEEQADKTTTEGTNNEANKQMAEVGTGMINNLQAEEITGVGEAATWYKNSSELKVFYNGLTFALVVDVSDDKNLNRNKSIELANLIIGEKLK
jgi:hypothetical protein